MRVCPSCGKKYEDGEAGHKLIAFDWEPDWTLYWRGEVMHTPNRLWICAVTAPALKQVLAKFDEKTHFGEWIGPMEIGR